MTYECEDCVKNFKITIDYPKYVKGKELCALCYKKAITEKLEE